MASPNMNLRDPVLYRILNAHTLKKKHYFIFPSYDFAHPLEDAIEAITHSLCSLEFEDHRPLYDWIVKATEMKNIPKQIEFGRLNITQTFLSKRNLKFLVDSRLVQGWDDPRMPTLKGVKKRGYTPESIKKFILEIGLSKNNTNIDKNMLDSCLRDDLQKKAKKAMAVIDPLKVTITNYPDNQIEYNEIPFHEEYLTFGSRKISFSKHIYIEKNDFQLTKLNKKSKKLFLNGEVRLLNFYFIKAYCVIKDDKGEIIEVLATYDPQTKSGSGFDKRKPNGTIHFVEKSTAQKAIFNFYKPLFNSENPNPLNLISDFNYNSWVKKEVLIEGFLKMDKNNEPIQFVRQGYFNIDHQPNILANFNEIILLKKHL
jgi:glutaminyl-tRNA synthetase